MHSSNPAEERFVHVARGLLRATHFGPTMAVTAITCLLGLEAGLGLRTVTLGLCVLTGQCSVGWSNDWNDAHRDLLGGRTEKPIVAGLVSRVLVAKAAFIALLASFLLAAFLGWIPLLIDIAALGSAWSYNLLLKNTRASPLPYAVSFGLLPIFVTQSLAQPFWPPLFLVAAAASLGTGAHFINTLKDTVADEQSGVRGLPQVLGSTWSLRCGLACLICTLAILLAFSRSLNLFAACVAGSALLCDAAVVISHRMHHDEMAWRLTILSAVCCVLFFLSSGSTLSTH